MCAIAEAITSMHDLRSEVGKMSLGVDFDCIAVTRLTTSSMLKGSTTFNDELVGRWIGYIARWTKQAGLQYK